MKMTVNPQNGTEFSKQSTFSKVSSQDDHFKGLQHVSNERVATCLKFSPVFMETG